MPKPYLPEEYYALQVITRGDGWPSQCLRSQVESLRNNSDFYRQTASILGALWNRNVRRKRGMLVFRCPWRYGVPDWQLPDRRVMKIGCIQFDKGSAKGIEVQLSNGLLHTAIVYKNRDSAEEPSINSVQMEREGIRIKSIDSILTPLTPQPVGAEQEYLKHLTTVALSVEFNVPRTVRLAPPSSAEDIVQCEERIRRPLPLEIRNIFTFANGFSFFGIPFYGSYDVIRSGEYLVLMEAIFGDASFFAFSLSNEPAKYKFYDGVQMNSFKSLADGLDAITTLTREAYAS